MQVEGQGKSHSVVGYGTASFDSAAIDASGIKDYEVIARAARDLFDKQLIGDITTRRAVLSLPAARSYHRTVQLPKLNDQELGDAVILEVEQYIPISKDELYIDYEITRQTAENNDVLITAVPRTIVDSYLTLGKILNLEVVGLETSISASGRLFLMAENSDIPTVLIDLGSLSADLTIYDQGLVITGTVSGGGDDFTNLIASSLGVTKQEAHIIKTKYGLGVSKKQKEITDGLSPLLVRMAKEIKRMIRYYEERSVGNRNITQVVTMGGGANMPGLSDYLTNVLRVPVRMCDPWQNLT